MSRYCLSMLLSVFSSKLCPTLCDPMDCKRARLPCPLLSLSEFAQTHVHWVGNAIQSSHPLSSPSPHALSLSQHMGLFQWVSSLHQVAKVLELQFQHQSFQWIVRVDFLLGLTGLLSLQSGSQEFSPVPQFKSINTLLLCLLYSPTLTSVHDYRKNHSFDYMNNWFLIHRLSLS